MPRILVTLVSALHAGPVTGRHAWQDHWSHGSEDYPGYSGHRVPQQWNDVLCSRTHSVISLSENELILSCLRRVSALFIISSWQSRAAAAQRRKEGVPVRGVRYRVPRVARRVIEGCLVFTLTEVTVGCWGCYPSLATDMVLLDRNQSPVCIRTKCQSYCCLPVQWPKFHFAEILNIGLEHFRRFGSPSGSFETFFEVLLWAACRPSSCWTSKTVSRSSASRWVLSSCLTTFSPHTQTCGQ